MAKQKYPGELCILTQVLTDWLFVTSAALMSMGLRAKALQSELDTANAIGSEVEAVRAKVRNALVSGDLKALRRGYSAARQLTYGFDGFAMAASGYEAGHSMGNKMASDEDGEMYDESGDSLDDVPF